MDRVFLDANVLFSAAYRPDASLRRLWAVANIQLLTSAYAADEARRNLKTEAQQADIAALLASVEIITASIPTDDPILATVRLPAKDRPIFLAAIRGNATHLLTGDVAHFGKYFDQRIGTVLIQTPAAYLRATAGQAQ
jgi:predicted nucleic acid-binding protein